MMTTWDHNSQIILEPNPNWRPEADPDADRDVDDRASRQPARRAYEAGELDMFLVPAADIRRVQDDPVMADRNPALASLLDSASARPSATATTTPRTQGPTANLNFRKALTQAIDKEALIELAWGGTGDVANTIVMPGMLALQRGHQSVPVRSREGQGGHRHGPDGARLSRARADVPVLRFTYNTGSDHENRVAFMAQAWTDTLGLPVRPAGLRVRGVPHGTPRSRVRHRPQRVGPGLSSPQQHS